MRLIDADTKITGLLYNEEREETEYVKMTVADYLDSGTEEGCPQIVSGWVSVKDRMPDKPCGCLVFNIYGWRALDFWEGDGWAVSDENEITHWMTLPLGPGVDK